MFRYKLRTLLIVLALGPPLLALELVHPGAVVFLFLLLGPPIAIAYWPQICGKGG